MGLHGESRRNKSLGRRFGEQRWTASDAENSTHNSHAGCAAFVVSTRDLFLSSHTEEQSRTDDSIEAPARIGSVSQQSWRNNPGAAGNGKQETPARGLVGQRAR